MRPTLSICIPTYNRCRDLALLLDSIIASAATLLRTGVLEVIVSDNASTDGSDELVRRHATEYPTIKYARNAQNVGFAANLNRAVELSSANYCWLMGSDEKVLKPAVALVLAEIENQSDVIIGNPVTQGKERHFLAERGLRRFQIRSAHDFSGLITQCAEVSSAFAFISTIVVKKAFWNSARCSTWELGHPYTHMLRLCKIISMGPADIVYLDKPLVETGYNTNEFNATILPHMELDLLTIEYIYDVLFDKSAALRLAYSAVFKSQYGELDVIKSRAECAAPRWRAIQPILGAFGYPPQLIKKRLHDPALFSAYLMLKRMRKLLRALTR